MTRLQFFSLSEYFYSVNFFRKRNNFFTFIARVRILYGAAIYSTEGTVYNLC